MCCVGRLQVHGICNQRLVYKEVAEALDYLNWKSKLELNGQVTYMYGSSNIYLKFSLCATTLRKWHIYEIVTLLMTY